MAKVLDDSRETADAPSRRRVLIADDDAAIRNLLKDFLGGEGFETVEARSGKEVLQAASTAEPDLMLLDLRMPDWDGMEVMRRLKERDLAVPVILMTAYGTSSSAIQAMQLGAFDYITKPFELEDVLLTVQRFFEHERLASEVRKLRGQLEGRDLTERIIGNTPAMQAVYKMIGRVAQTDATVLITGETGTGKELVAEVLHLFSTYRDGPLVKVNCAALPETLLESELFGHEKGSFTGAVAQHKGRFEMAHKGSIFLDEIGEMTLGTQKKLLRVLQEKEFERVGGTVPVKVDCRVIAATNKNLFHEAKEGTFREDLFYRLNVITIFMPPLRERKDDIPLLVEHFLNKYRYTPGSPPARISEDAMQILLEHQWPGNVRELEHAIQRAVVMSQGGVITREHLQVDPAREVGVINLDQKLQQGQDLTQIMTGIEAYLVGHALERSRGNRHQAAKLLGVDLATFERKLAEHGLAGE
ncbi:MAG TPA: sigma-54 dependent transcriptional regulator [Chloroflexota bacterium]|nr:sigma-54 dependent transcriptional regulator [Chloroflexota bacterium]